jgi:hypothetical protein
MMAAKTGQKQLKLAFQINSVSHGALFRSETSPKYTMQKEDFPSHQTSYKNVGTCTEY